MIHERDMSEAILRVPDGVFEDLPDGLDMPLALSIPDIFGFGIIGASTRQKMLPSREHRFDGGKSIVIHKSAKVHGRAYLQGPLYVGPNCEIGARAVVRRGVFLCGDNFIGEGSLVQNSLLFEGAQARRGSYVVNSMLGMGVYIDFGVQMSNLVLAYPGWIARMFGQRSARLGERVGQFGAIIGDGVIIGAGNVLPPGTIIKANTTVHEFTPRHPGLYDHALRSWISPEA